MRAHHSERRIGMNLRRCRNDLDRLARIFSHHSKVVTSILDRRFEYTFGE